MRTASLTMLGLILFGGAVRSDECASYGPVAWADAPRSGGVVASTVRFRVGLTVECGGVEGGGEHRFRVVDAAGVEVESRVEPWGDSHREVVPVQPLAAGRYGLEVRRPVGSGELGAWERLVEVESDGVRDDRAPDFSGIRSGEARAVRGSVPLSPCHVEEGWLLETRLRFPGADDGDRPHDDLLYRVDRRRGDGEAWEAVRTFRPSGSGDDRWFSWRTESGWGERWEYRLVVRDLSGHEVAGGATAVFTAPARPVAARRL